MSQHEQYKKVKYPEACLDRKCHFMLIVFSVDGVTWEDTKTATKKLSADLSKKWDREYLTPYRYVQVCISHNLVRAFKFLVRGAYSVKIHTERCMPSYRAKASILEKQVFYRN